MKESRPPVVLLLWLAFQLVSISSVVAGSPGSAIAFVDVNVIPMTDSRILEHQTVVVADGIITELGPVDSVEVPEGTVNVPGRGRYLIPGLTDAHVHLFSTTELPLYLVNGVTTVFNLNGRPPYLLWKKWIEAGKIPGPTIFTAGPTFDRPHTPEEAVRMVDEQAAAGYDAVKIYNQVSREEYAPLIAEARKKNLLLMGHIAREPGFEATLKAGQSIAHAEEFTYTFFNPGGGSDFSGIVFDETKIPVAARMTADAGVYVIPTISTFRDIIRQATDLDHYLENPQLKYLAPWVFADLQPGINIYSGRYSDEDVKQLQKSLLFQRKLVRALEDLGVPLLAGTDSTNIGPISGFSIHEELSELVKCGLTPYQALQTATVIPARYLRRSVDSGTIEIGKRADLVLLGADPFQDIAGTRNIVGVVVRGDWMDSDRLKAMIDEVPGNYERQVSRLATELKTDPVNAAQYLENEDPWGLIGSAALGRMAESLDAAQFHDQLLSMRARIPAAAVSGEEAMDELAFELLGQKKTSLAIQVFAENARDFPESIHALDALARAYVRIADSVNAVDAYSKALRLDPEYPNAEAANKYIREHSTQH